jgi:hypothetical protein
VRRWHGGTAAQSVCQTCQGFCKGWQSVNTYAATTLPGLPGLPGFLRKFLAHRISEREYSLPVCFVIYTKNLINPGKPGNLGYSLGMIGLAACQGFTNPGKPWQIHPRPAKFSISSSSCTGFSSPTRARTQSSASRVTFLPCSISV